MEKQLLLRQLFYRALHRGCKETDFLIGEFAKANLQHSEFQAATIKSSCLIEIEDLLLFKNFLQEDDVKIYDWILKKAKEPEIYKKLLQNIRLFHKI
jgi:antitoxin CptB